MARGTHVQSEPQLINKPAAQVFEIFSDFSRIEGQIPEDKRDSVEVTPDTLTFQVQGMKLGIQVVERIPFNLVRCQQFGASPFPYEINFHIAQISPVSCTLEIEMDVELPFMFKMMLPESKLSEAVNNFAQQFAASLNK